MPKAPSKETTFIRQHPTKKPVEIVELATKAGMKVAAKRINTVRKNDKQYAKQVARGKTGAAPRRITARAKVGAAKSMTVATLPAQELRRLAVELGLVRSSAILADLRARVVGRGLSRNLRMRSVPQLTRGQLDEGERNRHSRANLVSDGELRATIPIAAAKLRGRVDPAKSGHGGATVEFTTRLRQQSGCSARGYCDLSS